MGYELPVERWSPVQSVEKVLLSVVSMLAGESKTEEIKNVPESAPLTFYLEHKFPTALVRPVKLVLTSSPYPLVYIAFLYTNG